MSAPAPRSAVRVRFAPSPTGYLHVGGARTALFNWLFARHHGGVFILRIEDTDLERSSDELVRSILEGMEWLGMTPDEGPFFQTASRERHLADALALLASRHAYRCFCDPETLRREREAAEKAGTGWVYPRRCLGIPWEVSERRAAAGEPFAVRLRVPEGTVAWDDLVHGPTAFDLALIEDLVLLRSDRTPTYNLSVVSDDIAMGITEVIRGDDHLSNTPKQLLIYRALGKEPPRFAHLPMILGADRKRLSKRHGAVSVLDYRDQGYLADAVFNFLALLGWSPDDDREKMNREELVEAFDLSGVGRSPAVFDLKKLEWLNGQYLMSMSVEALVPEIRHRLEAAGLWREEYDGPRRDWFLRVVTLLQPRCRTLQDFVTGGRRFFDPSDGFPYDADAEKKHLRGEGISAHMEALRAALEALPEWTALALEGCLRKLAGERGISAARLIHPTRLAVTGTDAGPGLFEVLELIGRERALARLGRLLGRLASRAPAG